MFQIKLVLLNLILWFSLLPEAIRYGIAVLFPVRAQQKVLEEILAKMSMSMEVFHHHTLTHYEDYEDQIETLRRTGIHPTYHEEVLRLCPTSGTGGKNKLIPYTASLKAAFQKGVYPWIFFLYLRFPQLFFSRQYWSVTPIVMTEKGWGESRVQIGFEKDEDYAGYFQKLIMKTVWVDAAKVATDCPDARTFLGKLAGMLSQETNLGLISVWSPSLLAILVAQHGASLPHDLILSSWAHGSSKDESLRIAESLHATIQPKGLFSTEACTTISHWNKNVLPCL
jgi:hypothetical protein